MLKLCWLILISIFPHQLWAFNLNNESIVEHQIRICDDEKNILEAFKFSPSQGKKREIIYLETPDSFYKRNGWVIKIKKKPSEITVDIKKRMPNNENVPDLINLECELDKHGPSLEKTCKLTHIISGKLFNEVINKTKPWFEILSPAQFEWLNSRSTIKNNALFYGTLKNTRFEFNHPDLETLSIDAVHLDSDKKITFHEISIRYLESELEIKGPLFESFLKNKNILICPDQLDWSINKFDVMTAF